MIYALDLRLPTQEPPLRGPATEDFLFALVSQPSVVLRHGLAVFRRVFCRTRRASSGRLVLLRGVQRRELQLVDEADHAGVLVFHRIAVRRVAQAIGELAERVDVDVGEGALREAVAQLAQAAREGFGLAAVFL